MKGDILLDTHNPEIVYVDVDLGENQFLCIAQIEFGDCYADTTGMSGDDCLSEHKLAPKWIQDLFKVEE